MNKFAVSDNVYARDDRWNERKVLKSLRAHWLGKCSAFSYVCNHFCPCMCVWFSCVYVHTYTHIYYRYKAQAKWHTSTIEDFHSLFCVNAYTRDIFSSIYRWMFTFVYCLFQYIRVEKNSLFFIIACWT